MTTPSARRFFISYAREDEQWAEEKYRTLEDAGIEVFRDKERLKAGDEWPTRLLQEIERADHLWLGWSRFAAQSEWVRKEYELALRLAAERGAERFLRIELLDDTPLPDALKHIQARKSVIGSPEADRLLTDPYRELKLEATKRVELLRSVYQVVPFRGRTEVLDDIFDWCGNDEQPFAARLYVGPGGSGKTRLLAEACARLRAERWDTGFLDQEGMRAVLQAEPDRIDRLLRPRLPLLMVVDYAESRRDEVATLLRRATRKRDEQPVRLVLLARSAGEWWRELLRGSADIGSLVGSGAEPIAVNPLALVPRDREEAFVEAMEAFANVVGATVPRRSVGAPELSQVLLLHTAALLVVLGEIDVGEESLYPAELFARLLEHEERYWGGVARDVGLDKRLERTLAPGVALVTLAGGVEQGEELHALLQRVPLLEDQGRLDREQIAEVLRRLYGYEARIEALQPDRVGEALIARELSRDATFYRSWHKGAEAAQIRSGVTVLGRIAAEREEARGWLREVLAEDPSGRAMLAMDVAIEGNERVARVLTEVIESHADPELARELVEHIPQRTVVLRELAVVVTSQAVSDVEDEQERGRLLSYLGIRLSEVGRREDALTAAEEAVQIWRRLAEASPDAFLPDLGK